MSRFDIFTDLFCVAVVLVFCHQDEETRALMDTKSGRGGSRKSRNAVGQSEAVEMVQPSGTKWAGKKWAGRPDWRRIFKEQSKAHAGEEIGVFLCGPGAAELQAMCNKNSTADTAFVFHKEVF
uniref:Ferric reductase NAD binding domain-containing protein n=1 Tax=Tetraselmis chuii TaxID=63592 RepID=A0A7S1SRV3_9CHLO|mmetsp:Transcript_26398/g.46965  ORF Transcript_26398/g.46965 Transcript_26398/m.46965 type:complete len:123 (+) Transcript_26398:1-369(+)